MPRRVSDGLKRELREKLYIYENNLMNGCRVELSMYQDQFPVSREDMEDGTNHK